MDLESPRPEESSAGAKPFQFSLATMFVITAAFAIILMICFTLPDPWSGAAWLILTIAMPPVLAVIIKFGPGGLAAFSIGAIVPTGMSLAAMLLRKDWQSATPYPGYGWPSVQVGNRLALLGNWIDETSRIGAAWRPIAVSSFAAAILIGLLCVVVRRWLQRIGQ